MLFLLIVHHGCIRMRPGQRLALPIPNDRLFLRVNGLRHVFDALVEVWPLRSEALQVGGDLFSTRQRRHRLSDLPFGLLLSPHVLVHQAQLGMLLPIDHLNLFSALRTRLSLALLQLSLLLRSLGVDMHPLIPMSDLHIRIQRFVFPHLCAHLTFKLLLILIFLEIGLVFNFVIDFADFGLQCFR